MSYETQDDELHAEALLERMNQLTLAIIDAGGDKEGQAMGIEQWITMGKIALRDPLIDEGVKDDIQRKGMGYVNQYNSIVPRITSPEAGEPLRAEPEQFDPVFGWPMAPEFSDITRPLVSGDVPNDDREPSYDPDAPTEPRNVEN